MVCERGYCDIVENNYHIWYLVFGHQAVKCRIINIELTAHSRSVRFTVYPSVRLFRLAAHDADGADNAVDVAVIVAMHPPDCHCKY